MSPAIGFRDANQREEKVLQLGDEAVYVGREPSCGIRSANMLVSRRHASIRREGGTYWIKDLGSANGTKLKNQRIGRHALAPGDVVVCGSLTLRYIEEAARPAPAAPAAPPAASKRPPAQAPRTDRALVKLRESAETLRRERDEARQACDKEIAAAVRLRAAHERDQRRLEEGRRLLRERREVVAEYKRIVRELQTEATRWKKERDASAAQAASALEELDSVTRQLRRTEREAKRAGAAAATLEKKHAALAAARDDRIARLRESAGEIARLQRLLRSHEQTIEDQRSGLVNLAERARSLGKRNKELEAENARLKLELASLRPARK